MIPLPPSRQNTLVKWLLSSSFFLGLGLSLVLAGCGRQTAPKPLSSVLPPVQGVTVRHRVEGILISWVGIKDPDVATTGRNKGGNRKRLRSYRVKVEEISPGCGACPALSTDISELRVLNPALRQESGRLHVLLPPGKPGETLRLRVAGLYQRDWGPYSAAVLVHPRGDIPAADLRLETLAESLRFYWPAVREGTERVLGKSGEPEQRPVDYLGNLYAVEADGNTRLVPLNGVPITGSQWAVPALVLFAKAPREITVVLRLMDRQGGEGPPSKPVNVVNPLKRPR